MDVFHVITSYVNDDAYLKWPEQEAGSRYENTRDEFGDVNMNGVLIDAVQNENSMVDLTIVKGSNAENAQ